MCFARYLPEPISKRRMFVLLALTIACVLAYRKTAGTCTGACTRACTAKVFGKIAALFVENGVPRHSVKCAVIDGTLTEQKEKSISYDDRGNTVKVPLICLCTKGDKVAVLEPTMPHAVCTFRLSIGDREQIVSVNRNDPDWWHKVVTLVSTSLT